MMISGLMSAIFVLAPVTQTVTTVTLTGRKMSPAVSL